jgi:MFS transporter, DHA1 family, tetracycline resistance protein
MDNLELTAKAISSTIIISGLVSLAFPFILGWLSDRLGRKRMMIICYASYAFSIVILIFSKSLWHFSTAMVLIRIGMVSTNLGAAFATDLVDPKALGRGVSLSQGVVWIAIAIGYVSAGNAFQNFGMATTLFISAALPIIGIILIISNRVTKQKEPVT